jgi:hypothetical protein
MARLRIRIELNRGGVGVPLHKFASVVDEAQKFFHMLAEDVRIEKGKGEWLGFDFDHESLNFTAEYVGPVTTEQVQAFYAAFDGTTKLRRGTIDQFARITGAIGEDELIGFGLYQGDEGAEPSDWRCLSRRDALRIADEIQFLLGASGETDRESHLPAVSDATMGARLFGERRDRSADQGKVAEFTRDMESALSKRLTRVENKLEEHSGLIHDIRSESAAAEQSFRNLLSAVEGFCDQAARQIERVAPLGLSAAPSEPRSTLVRKWTLVAIAAVLSVVVVYLGFRFWPTRAAQPFDQKVAAASPALPVPVVTPPAPAPLVRRASMMRVDLQATEPTWISLTDVAGKKLLVGLLVPGDSRSIELTKSATLRTGNAGGLKARLDGKPLGPIGLHGKVVEIEFKDGGFKLAPNQ